MAHLRKLPSGKWNAMVYSHTDQNGKKKYVSFTASTKAEANRLAAEFVANKEKEEQPQDILIGKCVDNYIKSKSNIISPKTLKEYRANIKYYEPLAQIRLGSITSVDLQNFVNDLSKDKSPKTVRNIYSLLISSIKMYSDRSYRVTLPAKQDPQRNIPTDADVKVLLENANPRLKLAIILGSVGVRRGEAASLKFGDILYDFNAIFIHSDIVLTDDGWFYKNYAKTSKSTRRIRVPKEIIEMIGTGNEDDYVLGILPSTITSDFINLRNKLGLKCRYHDLRHYSASIMHYLGIPDTYIMEHHGWESDKVLKSVYRNVLSDKVDSFTNAVNKYLSENILSETQMESGSQTS